MNVPNIRQDPGSVSTLSRAVADGEHRAELESAATERGRSSGAAAPTSVSFTRLAWFDVNGDGHIDPRSAAAGGDATLLVPSDAVDLPTYSRNVTPLGDTHSAKAPEEERDDRDNRAAPAGNPAQTNRAVDAYQRYGGQTPPAPAAAPTPVALPAAGGAPSPPVLAVGAIPHFVLPSSR